MLKQQTADLTRYCDDCFRHRPPQVCLCCLLHLCQNKAADLAGGVFLAVNLQDGVHTSGFSPFSTAQQLVRK